MTEIEHEDEERSAGEQARELDPLSREQEGKGYGEDEGERDQSLDE